MKSRTQKVFFNMFTSLVEQIISVICGLIIPKLILTNFGSTYNGVVASATQFLSVLNILTLGITGATRVALYKPLAENDNLTVSRLMKASKQYMRKVSICVVAYIAVLCVVYPFVSKNDLTWSQNAVLILIVSISSLANYLFGINNIIILQASQCNYVTNIADIIKIIINTICVAVLIKIGCSIYVVKLGSSLIFFIVPMIISIYISRKFSLTNDCDPLETEDKSRKAVAAHSVANIIHDNVDLLTLTFFIDAKIISVYTVYNTIISKIKMLLRVFTSGMEAAFGDMWVKREYSTLSKSFKTYEYMMFTLITIIFSCVSVLLLPFVRVYTSGVNDVNYILPTFAALITIAEGIYCIRQPYMTLVYATGSYAQTKKVAIGEAGINLILSIVLVNIMGISGVIMATIVANLFCTSMFVYFTSKNILKRSVYVVIRRIAWALFCISVTIVLSNLIGKTIVYNVSWFGWLIEAVVVFAISVVTTLLMSLLFYKEDLTNLMKKAISVIKKVTLKQAC